MSFKLFPICGELNSYANYTNVVNLFAISPPFQQLLIDIHQKTMEEQKQILDDTIEKWRGDSEQIDDICVIGVRV